MEENILIVHGGGPTAVINGSLYGAVTEARKYPQLQHIYAARNGTGGLLREELIDLTNVEEEKLKLLLQTPGSAIGTSRDQLEKPEWPMATVIPSFRISGIISGIPSTSGETVM